MACASYASAGEIHIKQFEASDGEGGIVQDRVTTYQDASENFVLFIDVKIPPRIDRDEGLRFLREGFSRIFPGLKIITWVTKSGEEQELCMAYAIGQKELLTPIAVVLDDDRKHRRDLPPTNCFRSFPHH